MAINKSDFNKIWASTSPLTPYTFTESTYKEGWNFIGATPPARQMWDSYFKWNDEKQQFIVNDLLVPVDIDETANSGDYYTTTVPTDQTFANFDSIGGKTIAWNQLAGDVNNNGHTTKTADGTYSVTDGTYTDAPNSYFKNADGSAYNTIVGHKYYVYLKTTGTCTPTSPGVTYFVVYDGDVFWASSTTSANSQSVIKTVSASTVIYVRTYAGTYSNFKAYIKIIDLTLAFGSGNEPTTTAEVEALFPAETYPYNAGTLLSAGVSNVISKDSSNNVLANMPIPSAIQSLDGYGWSAGSVYNYIDFERKMFVKRVGKVVLDGSSLVVDSVSQSGSNYRFQTSTSPFANAKYYDTSQINITSAPIEPSYYYVLGHPDEATFNCLYPFYSNNKLYITMVGSSITTISAMNTWLQSNPVTIYYELATPIETDISAILGASGIATSSGGSLTFQNSNGDNYRLPVPVSLDYVADADGLMTAQDKAKLDMIYDYIQRVGL